MDNNRPENRRKEQREQIIGNITYSYASAMNRQAIDAVITDISNSGLGILIKKPVTEGVGLEIAGHGLWDNSRYAVVRWCQKMDFDVYKAGLRFN